MGVVADQHERPEPFDEPDRQPVQAVQDRARPALVLTDGRCRAPEHGRGAGGCTGEELIAASGGVQQRFEQLVDGPERNVLLEAAAATATDGQAARRGRHDHAVEQSRLADPRRAFDDHDPAFAGARSIEQRVELDLFVFALEQWFGHVGGEA
jgi:hypothetical protein